MITSFVTNIRRFGELGSLEEIISQRFDFGDDGRLTPQPADGGLDEKEAGSSLMSSKQMMISTITMAVGDAEGDWKAAEDILGLYFGVDFIFSRELYFQLRTVWPMVSRGKQQS